MDNTGRCFHRAALSGAGVPDQRGLRQADGIVRARGPIGTVAYRHTLHGNWKVCRGLWRRRRRMSWRR
jgi:hypothetical protein